MTITHTPKGIAGGFALAVVSLCLGMFLSTKAGDLGGAAVWRIFNVVAALIVVRCTFAWGRNRGFPARREDGSFAIGNILRTLVVAVMMWFILLIAFAPLIMASFELAR